MWEPKTAEDYLIKQYLDENPGILFLEAPVFIIENLNRARRIDGILIPGEEIIVYPQGSYNIEQLQDSIKDKTIHLIEAKRKLDRYVIGQLLVGESLVNEVYRPEKIIMVMVSEKGNLDIEWYCNNNDIKIAIYPKTRGKKLTSKSSTTKTYKDYRKSPDSDRYRAFLAGWTDAVNGKLYGSIFNKKTHANMGNMFGWIYGDQSLEFRKNTWEIYVMYSKSYKSEVD